MSHSAVSHSAPFISDSRDEKKTWILRRFRYCILWKHSKTFLFPPVKQKASTKNNSGSCQCHIRTQSLALSSRVNRCISCTLANHRSWFSATVLICSLCWSPALLCKPQPRSSSFLPQNLFPIFQYAFICPDMISLCPFTSGSKQPASQSHQSLVEHSPLGPPPWVPDSVGLDWGVWEFASLLHPQAMLMLLLVRGPQFENHCPKPVLLIRMNY